MSGTRYVTRGQLVNTRPNDVAAAAASVYNETGVPDDPIDDPLYEYVQVLGVLARLNTVLPRLFSTAFGLYSQFTILPLQQPPEQEMVLHRL